MGKIAIKIGGIFSCKRQFQHVPDSVDDVEDFRRRGCEILKAISESGATKDNTPMARTKTGHANIDTAPYTTNHGNSIEMDWHETIQKVNAFQQQQKRTQKDERNQEEDEPRSKVHRLKRLKRALERRRKFDNKGSFAVNMVTYRDEFGIKNNDETCDEQASTASRHQVPCDGSKYGDVLGCDDRSVSRSSVSTLRVIDEETDYDDST